jgi:hypothetical protein
MSALKQVLNRRLFRHGGMLGPEDPQGILNSSNALANVVRMQNGGYNDIGAAEMRGATAPIFGPARQGIYLGDAPSSDYFPSSNDLEIAAQEAMARGLVPKELLAPLASETIQSQIPVAPPAEETGGQTIYPGKGLEVSIPTEEVVSLVPEDVVIDEISPDRAIPSIYRDWEPPTDPDVVVDVPDGAGTAGTAVDGKGLLREAVGGVDAGPVDAGPVDAAEPNAIDAIAGVLSDPDRPIEEKEKTIDEYKQEFIDALPGYEGKTQFEKGMDLAAFGAAIMAGRSQHAIQNIGDAFLAVGDKFTTDDKERRAYNSLINFSGAKYGMERVNKLRDEQRASERELLSYKNTTDKDIMINGSRVAAGDWTLLPKAYLLREGLPPGFKSESLHIAESKAAVTRFTQMRTLLKESQEVGMLTEPETKRLTKTYKDNIDNIERSNGIINDIVTLRRFLKDNPGKITSWTSLGSAGKDAFLNALGISPETGEMTREQFLGMTSTALNKGIPVALRENQSANSISNFDVKTFAKGYFDGLGIPEDGTIAFKQIFKNPEVLYTKLGEFYEQLENKRDGSLVELRTVDNELLGRKMPGISDIGGGIYQIPIYRPGSELTRPYREGRPWEQEVAPLLRREEGQTSGLVFNRETGVYDIVKRSPYPTNSADTTTTTTQLPIYRQR